MRANAVSTPHAGQFIPRASQPSHLPKDDEPRKPLLSELNERLSVLTSRASDLVAHLTLINNAALGTAPDSAGAAGTDSPPPAGNIHEAFVRCDTLGQILEQIAAQIARAAVL